MKFLKICFHDNDYGNYFLNAADKVLDRLELVSHQIKWTDEFLEYIKNAFIKLVSAEVYMNDVGWFGYNRALRKQHEDKLQGDTDLEQTIKEKVLKNIDTKASEEKSMLDAFDCEEYLSNIELYIVDGRLEDIKHDDSDILYMPLRSNRVVPFLA